MNEKEIRKKLAEFTEELEGIKTPEQYHEYKERFQEFIMLPEFQKWIEEYGNKSKLLERYNRAFSKFINEVVRPKCGACKSCSSI